MAASAHIGNKEGRATPNKKPDEPAFNQMAASTKKPATTSSRPSERRFQEMAKKVMASSARRSSTDSLQGNSAVLRSRVRSPTSGEDGQSQCTANDVQSNQMGASAKMSATISARPSSSSSTKRFQEMAKKVMASSARWSTTSSLQGNSAVLRSHIRPPIAGKDGRSHSIANDGLSHHHSHLSHTGIIAGTVNEPDDSTHHQSHLGASNNVSRHGLPHFMTPRSITNHDSLKPVRTRHANPGGNKALSVTNQTTPSIQEDFGTDSQPVGVKPLFVHYKPHSTKSVKRRASKISLPSPASTKVSPSKQRSLELCKDCQAYTMASVCYISNEGRIAAAVTFAHHSHHCNVPRCAANQKYNPPSSSSASPKKALLSEKQSRHFPSTYKSTTSLATGLEDDCSACSSSLSSVREDGHKSTSTMANESGVKYSEEKTSQLPGASIDQNNSSGISSEDQTLLVSTKVSNGDMEYGTSCSTPAASCISSEAIDSEKISLNRDDVEELNDFRSFYYHGDNEYSCSENGTEFTTTPRSLTHEALEDVSNADSMPTMCNKSPQPQRTTVARMRQKYLNSLKEQEAETVRLRKQEMMARKQAGDWMLDCHMEELLHKLAPNGEARVKVLVEAFETIIHHSDSEGSQTHNQG